VAIDQQPGGDKQPQVQPHAGAPDVAPPMPAHGAARRRLAKAGLGAAGVLWTLESRATLKHTGFVCESASAAASAGLNSNAATDERCNPLSPTAWSFVQYAWPCSKSKRFRDVFSCNEARFRDTYYPDTLLGVMTAKYDSYNIGRHLATAYLNVLSKRIDFLEVQTLQRMWNELKNNGHYKVNANEYWTVLQVRNYLVSVHGV
jgi:hypothetical protein